MCLKSWERPERRVRPFPSIADELPDSECAVASRACLHGFRLPLMEIEVAMRTVWLGITPGILAHVAGWRAVSGPVELLFGRQALAQPLRISPRFTLRNIDRPIERQRNFFEHSPIKQ